MALSLCTASPPFLRLAAQQPWDRRRSCAVRAARCVVVRASFNPQDPLSWGQDQRGDVQSFGNGEALQQLTDAELFSLLSSTGQQQAQAQPAATVRATAAPESAAEAIAAGIQRFAEGNHAEALALFSAAEQLPGSGQLRVRGKPRELSEGELQAARYNAGAALAQLGRYDEAFVLLSACLDAGFDDAAGLERDADFTQLKAASASSAAEFEALLERIRRSNPPPSGFLQRLFRF